MALCSKWKHIILLSTDTYARFIEYKYALMEAIRNGDAQ